jgi:hypothetical protein
MTEQAGFPERLERIRGRQYSAPWPYDEDIAFLLYWLDDYMECLGDVIEQRDALILETL